MLLPLKISHSLHSNRFFSKLSASDEVIEMTDYKETFSRRMAMAGIKPNHRIALGVSGGPDSIGLCVLASGWKTNALIKKDETSGCIDGLLGIVVDHRLRPESTEEAQSVRDRVLKMGIRCEVAACNWLDGRPKLGHLQEAARDMRYQIFQDVCLQQQIQVLLIAHHADDQAELFILRLSRTSGVLGLAGMAFSSQLFPSCLHYGETSSSHGIIVVRPLLDFSKEDMYKICQGGGQVWVEDPTNQSALFARNRIRMSLRDISSCTFKSELQAVISACRITRSCIDHICRKLIDQSVTIVPHGYAIIDLKKLDPSSVEDLCLAKFVALVLQFVSQRHRPIRGRVSQSLLNYVRNTPCKTSLTAAGCYLCAAPGSKGTTVIVCCSLDSPHPSKTKLSHKYRFGDQHLSPRSEIEQIITEAKSYAERVFPNASHVPFSNITCSKSVLSEAKKLNILSESNLQHILLLQSEESKHFNVKSELKAENNLKYNTKSAIISIREPLQSGQICHFMNRFYITWKMCGKVMEDRFPMELNDFNWDSEVCQDSLCSSCVVGQDTVAEVRHMVEDDWLYLSKLSKNQISEYREQMVSVGKMERNGARTSCSEYLQLSAQRALWILKSIPASARRGLPVLVNPQGLLLSIPSICFRCCPYLSVLAVFKPRVPLGGGYSSYL